MRQIKNLYEVSNYASEVDGNRKYWTFMNFELYRLYS